MTNEVRFSYVSLDSIYGYWIYIDDLEIVHEFLDMLASFGKIYDLYFCGEHLGYAIKAWVAPHQFRLIKNLYKVKHKFNNDDYELQQSESGNSVKKLKVTSRHPLLIETLRGLGEEEGIKYEKERLEGRKRSICFYYTTKEVRYENFKRLLEWMGIKWEK